MTPPGGESLEQLASRVRSFVERLRCEHAEETVLLVSHGGPLRVLLATSLGLPATDYWRLRIAHGSFSEIYLYPEGGMLTRLNFCPELEKPDAQLKTKVSDHTSKRDLPVGRLILITGGARSGKSAFAEQLAQTLGGDQVLFVATAEARDEDMARRIAAHRRSRPVGWLTEEAPREVGRRLRAALGGRRVALIDCLTLLVSNTILTLGESPDLAEAESLVAREIDDLIEACDATSATVIIVSNEVGLGLVPMNPLGRVFRDTLGRANQSLAARAESVYVLLAGIPVDVKQLAAQIKTPETSRSGCRW